MVCVLLRGKGGGGELELYEATYDSLVLRTAGILPGHTLAFTMLGLVPIPPFLE